MLLLYLHVQLNGDMHTELISETRISEMEYFISALGFANESEECVQSLHVFDWTFYILKIYVITCIIVSNIQVKTISA